MSIVVGILVTVAVAAVLFARVGPLLARRGTVDAPNHRTSHEGVVARGGGIGIVLGFLAGLLAYWLLGGWVNQPMQTLVAAAVALAVVGALEDLLGLMMIVRLAAQAIVPTLAIGWLVYNQFFGLTLGIICIVAAIFYVNAANFMDGVNGISSFHAIAVGVYWVYWGFHFQNQSLLAYALLFGIAFAAFLPWNLTSKLFMGDSGSYFLGAGVWGLSVMGLIGGLPLVVVFAPLTIYAVDVVVTLLWRIWRRQPIQLAHRDHVYQRIQQLTGSHLIAAGWTTLLTVACAIAGWITYFTGRASVGIIALAIIALAYVVSPWIVRLMLGKPRPPKAPSRPWFTGRKAKTDAAADVTAPDADTDTMPTTAEDAVPAVTDAATPAELSSSHPASQPAPEDVFARPEVPQPEPAASDVEEILTSADLTDEAPDPETAPESDVISLPPVLGATALIESALALPLPEEPAAAAAAPAAVEMQPVLPVAVTEAAVPAQPALPLGSPRPTVQSQGTLNVVGSPGTPA
ncbi:MAG: hypothetical protein IPM11_05625 [Micropruina sp.]|jgi:UDP-N-acetylmuramyl pentapeptide phosphotransferase/UDP-N-acetylglucosamine-1-phosphate transferase|nr:hypothetical protein [Micropruina sp.]